LTIKSRWLERRRHKAAQARQDEIMERAARLGITADRVLEEYARIAFADLGHIVEWDEKGMKVQKDAELGAVAEIVQGAGSGKPYRVKLYDKRAALDAIARYLGMSLPEASTEDEPTRNDKEDPREAFIRELDRLAAQIDKGSGDMASEPRDG
jgi:hypothetical protein